MELVHFFGRVELFFFGIYEKLRPTLVFRDQYPPSETAEQFSLYSGKSVHFSVLAPGTSYFQQWLTSFV